VATGTVGNLSALSSTQISAAQAYITTIGDARTTYTVTSNSADLLYVSATVYYQGQYSGVLPGAAGSNTTGTVCAAINTWLQNLSITNFDGSLKVSDLENTIRNVQGVNDVVLNVVNARAASTPALSGTVIGNLVNSNTVISRSYSSVAGYLNPETTTGYMLGDSLTFIAQ
jgi:uncharacterized phage protein gp47/JayE